MPTFSLTHACDNRYTIALRKSLDLAECNDTMIVLPDYRLEQYLLDAINASSPAFNATFARAVYALGTHGCGNGPQRGVEGHRYWCSESEVSNGWTGAQKWGGIPLTDFVVANQTATTSWSLIWSVPPAVGPYQNRGAMLAAEPWSGYYRVDGTIWMLAHWCQFTQVGWKLLAVDTGGSGVLPGGGKYVTLVSPTESDVAIVVDYLTSTSTSLPLEFSFSHLPSGAHLAVWRTNAEAQFQRIDTLTPQANGSIFLVVDQGAIYTLTSRLSGPTKGNYSNVPPSALFSLPYSDDFDQATANDTLARFFADLGGSWAVIVPPASSSSALDSDALLAQVPTEGLPKKRHAGNTNYVLAQMAPVDPGPNSWHHGDPDPITIIGDLNWTNVRLSASGRIPYGGPSRTPGLPPAYLELCGRIGVFNTHEATAGNGGVCVRLNEHGIWRVTDAGKVVANGTISPPGTSTWHAFTLVISEGGHTFATIDGTPLTPTAVQVATGAGMASLGSGWHSAYWDNFSVVPLSHLLRGDINDFSSRLSS